MKEDEERERQTRRQRNKLVAALQKSGCLRDSRVAEAFATVPRHLFVPDQPSKDVYTNRAFVTKKVSGVPVSSSSEPSIMAIMLEMLDVPPDARVLEIGAGTGYNAALLAHLAGKRGTVTAVDLDPDTARAARKHLRDAGTSRVRVIAADGALGHSRCAPYDRIIVTASCWQIPQAWIDQLVDGGRIVLPLRLNGVHVCLALQKRGRELVSSRASMCGFMPMRGLSGRAYSTIIAGGSIASSDLDLSPTARHALERTLKHPTSVRVRFPRQRDAANWSLHYFALQGKPLLTVFRAVDASAQLFGLMVSPRSIVTLPWSRPPRGALTLFGNGDALDYLQRSLAQWQSEGRPDLRHLVTRVVPASRKLGPLPRRAGDRFRFRRGDHLYEMWFER